MTSRLHWFEVPSSLRLDNLKDHYRAVENMLKSGWPVVRTAGWMIANQRISDYWIALDRSARGWGVLNEEWCRWDHTAKQLVRRKADR